jgi:hypothetical protein
MWTCKAAGRFKAIIHQDVGTTPCKEGGNMVGNLTGNFNKLR